MICLSDNDIIGKLASCELLEQLPSALGVGLGDIVVLETARYIFRGPKAARVFGRLAVERAGAFIDRVWRVDAPPDAELSRFTDVVGIDRGDAVLFAVAAARTDAFVVTGDKRSIRMLAAAPECSETAVQLRGRVVCLEQIVSRLIEQLGFDHVRNKVVPAMSCDTALRAAFGSGTDATAAAVQGALEAYIADLRPLRLLVASLPL